MLGLIAMFALGFIVGIIMMTLATWWAIDEEAIFAAEMAARKRRIDPVRQSFYEGLYGQKR